MLLAPGSCLRNGEKREVEERNAANDDAVVDDDGDGGDEKGTLDDGRDNDG